MQTLQLTAFGFKMAEMISVPGSRVSEGDCSTFGRSSLVKAGGEHIVVGVDQFSRGDG